MRDKPNKSLYLNKSFDFTKLTKDQLREILFDNNIPDIPPANSKKDVFIDFYKKNIHDKIDLLKKEVKPNDEGIEYDIKSPIKEIITKNIESPEQIDLFRKKSKSPLRKEKSTNQINSSFTQKSEDKSLTTEKPTNQIDSPFTKKREDKSTKKEDDSLFLKADTLIHEKIERINFKNIFLIYSLISLFLFNLFYNGPFFNAIFELFFLILIFLIKTYFLKKELHKINTKLRKESERVYEEILVKIKKSALKGKSVNVAVIKDKYTDDSRVWYRVRKLVNGNKRIMSRKGMVEGKRVDVWEYKL